MWKISLILVSCFAVYFCTTKTESEQIYSGRISIPMSIHDGIILLKTSKQIYELKTNPQTQYSGITVEDGSVFWDIDHQYEVKGKMIDTQKSQASRGDKKTLMASFVKYLGPPPYDPDKAIENEIVTNDIVKVNTAINKGAKLDRKIDGGSLLHYAAKWSNKDIIALLINKGLDVNQKDIDGNTPLHIAVKYCKLGGITKFEKKIEMLLDKGADPKNKNNNGQTPWNFAQSGVIDDLCRMVVDSFTAKFK